MMAAISVSAPLAAEHVFDYCADLEPPLAIGPGPSGMRVFWQARGGRVDGPRLRAEILPGGGDWALTGNDRWTRLDVRGVCRTDDGALLYFSYGGVVEPTSAVLEALASGGETRFEDQYFRIAMTVETGDPRYAWLTQSVLVGRGRIVPGPGVAYEIFRVA